MTIQGRLTTAMRWATYAPATTGTRVFHSTKSGDLVSQIHGVSKEHRRRPPEKRRYFSDISMRTLAHTLHD